jgi:hypothetical protein
MWELMAIGIEMQERMIEVHGKGLKLSRQMLDASEKQLAVGKALNAAAKAQADFVDQWFDMWRWRI